MSKNDIGEKLGGNNFSFIEIFFCRCKHCDEKFLMVEELCSHLNQKHDQNLVQFQCSHCSMAFYEKSGYLVHQKTHDKNFETYFCAECSEVVTSHYELYCHDNSEHYKAYPKIFACEKCKFWCKDSDKIVEHMEDEHEILDFKPFLCPKEECDMRFET